MDIAQVFSILRKEVPKYNVPIVDLIKIQTNDPVKILLATLLSARTKDETTAKAAERLFSKVKKISDLNKLTQIQIEKLIYPVGFYKTKAKHLKQLPKVLQEEFSGKIPKTVDELVKFPGVGRKTANLVVAVAFNDYAICVDTHVHRISNRLGYIKTKTPHETEILLRKKLPKKYWKEINMFFVAFGQNICKPISPICSMCPIYKHCKRIGVKSSR